jgi:hypothetical protein
MLDILHSFGQIFLVFGPLVIILVGIIATVLLASLWTGWKKWVLLFLWPVVTLSVISLPLKLASDLTVERSGFLLGGAILATFLLGIVYLYYPILIIKGIVDYFRFRKQKNKEKVEKTISASSAGKTPSL